MAKAETALEQHPAIRGERGKSEALHQNDLPINYSNSVYFLLTPEVQDTLDRMLPLVLREVGIAPNIEVYGTAASDEIEAHLVVSVKTELSAEKAFALWDRVGDAVQEWTATLPMPQQEIALGVVVEVLWDAGHAAI